MKFFNGRPLCLFCSLYLITRLTLFGLSLSAQLILLALGLGALTVYILLRRRISSRFRILILPITALITGAAMSFFFISLPMRRAEKLTAESHRIEGYVIERISFADYRSVYEVHLTAIDGKSCSNKLRLNSSAALDLAICEKFEAEGSFVLFSENINGYPERRVMAARGIFSAFEASAVTPLGEYVSTLTGPLVRFREKLTVILERYIGGNESKLTAALLLADRERLPKAIKRDFEALGLSHILAMSGMHLAILTGIAERLMKKIRIPKKLRLILLSVVILLFTLLVGAPLSVVRSAWMLIICYFAELLHMKQDKTTALLLAATMICSFSPGAVMDAGLQLSFAAALGITVSAPGLKKILCDKLPEKFARRTSGFIADLAASISALLFTLPFSALYFGRISLLSPLATPIVTPFVQIILAAAPLLLISAALPTVATVFAMFCRLSAQCMFAITQTGEWLHDVSVSLEYPFSALLIFGLTAGAALLFFSGKGNYRRWCMLTATFILFYGFGTTASAILSRDDSVVIFANNGNKDYLCISHSNENILCDISDGSYSGIYRLTEAMREQIYDDRFDGVMLTHYHRKHAAMLYRLSQEHYIERLILPTPETEDEQLCLDDLMLLAESENIAVEFYRRGNEFSLCALKIETIPRSTIKRSTHPLIALKFTGRDGSIAYIGAAAYQTSIRFTDAMLILGGHGPRIKDEISLPANCTAVALSEDAYLALTDREAVAFRSAFGCILRSRS